MRSTPTRLDDAQVALLTDALKRPMPRTSGVPSVFQQTPPPCERRLRAVTGAPDPRSLKTIPWPPPKRKSTNPRSPWWAVWESMRPGEGLVMSEEQAVAFTDWARKNGLKLSRQRLEDGSYGVGRIS